MKEIDVNGNNFNFFYCTLLVYDTIVLFSFIMYFQMYQDNVKFWQRLQTVIEFKFIYNSELQYLSFVIRFQLYLIGRAREREGGTSDGKINETKF